MTERPDRDEDRLVALHAPAGAASLPYAVEVWEAGGARPERVLGRGASMVVARAIFEAAATEHPDRRIVLRRGTKLISDTE
ncbi:MAG: hypothetical protein ACOY5Y_06450 [Pseudomonadota bacterium]|jgi:hypothetical protein